MVRAVLISRKEEDVGFMGAGAPGCCGPDCCRWRGKEEERKRERRRGRESERDRLDRHKPDRWLWFVVCGLWFVVQSLTRWLASPSFPASPQLNSRRLDHSWRERERGVQYVLFLRLVSSCDPYTDPLVFLARIA